jgi:hypothetical protein
MAQLVLEQLLVTQVVLLQQLGQVNLDLLVLLVA